VKVTYWKDASRNPCLFPEKENNEINSRKGKQRKVFFSFKKKQMEKRMSSIFLFLGTKLFTLLNAIQKGSLG